MTTSAPSQLPALPLEAWEQSKITFHLYLQIVGKIRASLTPDLNHWWHVTHYVTVRGLTTSSIPMPEQEGESFVINFDLIDHVLEITTSRGEREQLDLKQELSVAEFYKWCTKTLQKLGVEINILAKPFDMPVKKPFEEITEYAAYDKEYIHRFWKIMLWVDQTFREFNSRFYGKTCPVHIYWHHMDLAVTRFSGKKAPALPAEASEVEKRAYSHEDISFGFWAGDEQMREAAFYSYTYPAPDKLDEQPLQPASAFWAEQNGSPMALLTYEKLRKEADPRQALLSFMESAYQAGAKLAAWDVEGLKVEKG